MGHEGKSINRGGAGDVGADAASIVLVMAMW